MANFKILTLLAEFNDTPNGEDIILVISEEEFMRMWQRGQAMLRNRAVKGQKVDGDFTRSIEIS